MGVSAITRQPWRCRKLPEFSCALKGCSKTTQFKVNSKNESPEAQKNQFASNPMIFRSEFVWLNTAHTVYMKCIIWRVKSFLFKRENKMFNSQLHISGSFKQSDHVEQRLRKPVLQDLQVKNFVLCFSRLGNRKI